MDSNSPALILADGGIPNRTLQDKVQQLKLKRKTASSSENLHHEFVHHVWPGLRDEYDEMMNSLKMLCENSLEQRGITCRVEGRTKTKESVDKSLIRRKQNEQGQYESFGAIFREMHDLVGIRIVLDFPSDLEKVKRFIQEMFYQEKTPAFFSPDRKVGQSWETWFGAYQTWNYRVSLPNEKDGALSQFCGVMFEIQLTTIIESLYNKFAHPLLYKGTSGPLTRKDEMVIDLSHGLSLCYGLCMVYMQEKLESKGNKDRTEEDIGASPATTAVSEPERVYDIVACGDRLFQDMTRGMGKDGSSSVSNRLEDLPKRFGKSQDEIQSIGNLRNWLSKELDSIQKDLAKEKLSDKDKECHQQFRLTTGSEGATYEWYKDRVEDRIGGTCQWFLSHDHFQRWLKQESGPLLVSADPGCGKSVLAKFLIDHELPRSSTICYFFFKEQDQNTVRQALCALLHQLLSQKPSLIKHAREQYNKDGQNLSNSTSSLWTILENAVQDPHAGLVIIVLDALDECKYSELEYLIRNIKRQFRDSQLRYSKLRYLLTSRPYEQVVSRFQDLLGSFPYIRIPGEGEEASDTISHEVDLVIEYQVDQLAREKKLSAQVKSHLTRVLSESQHRTYLWVYLVFDLLKTDVFKRTPKGIESAIRLPHNVHQAYDQILIKSKDPLMVRKVLSIILAAERPLTLSEMNIAVNIDRTGSLDLEEEDDFKQRLRSSCGLFVSVYHSKVYFLHQTAREFLLADLSAPTTLQSQLCWHGSITTIDAHTVLSEVCIAYLDVFNAGDPLPSATGEADQSIDRYTLLDYSARYWSSHVRKGSINDSTTIVASILILCDPDSNSWSAWFEIFWKARFPGEGIPADFTGLMIASLEGLDVIVQRLLEMGADVNAEDGVFGRTALSHASGGGHEAVVKQLLDTGRVDPDAKDYKGWTALSHASGGGHEAVVKQLLDTGRVDPDAKDNNGWTALSYAAEEGHEVVVKQLLDTGRVDPDAKNNNGWTVLFYAAGRGHEAVVKQLLDTGRVDPDAKDNEGRTALSYAAWEGHEVVLKQLLDTGRVDLDAKDNEGWTALFDAAGRGHEAVVKQLLDTGRVDPDAKDNKGRMALSYAAWEGHVAVVKQLLDTGRVDPDTKDDGGWTAHFYAAGQGHVAVVKQLLDTGRVDPDTKDNNGWTALLYAAGRGHEAVVKQLQFHL